MSNFRPTDHQLHHADSRDECHRHRSQPVVRYRDLRGLHIHPVGLHGAEHRLDGPARAIQSTIRRASNGVVTEPKTTFAVGGPKSGVNRKVTDRFGQNVDKKQIFLDRNRTARVDINPANGRRPDE